MPELKETIRSYSEKLLNDFSFNKIVLQPTTTCNLNCTYCYLADRDTHHNMSIETANAISESIEKIGKPILLIWHGGEPLATGKQHFINLLNVFEKLRLKKIIRHCIQTNATLIDAEWCELFKYYEIKVGISTDGPDEYNQNRVNWANKQVTSKIMAGINFLKQYKIRFSVICVLSEKHLQNAKLLYDYFVELGCSSVGFNSPEREGSNDLVAKDFPELQNFWKELYQAWNHNPVIRVRELTYALSWIDSSIRRGTTRFIPKLLDLIPTISWNGNVVALSPEFSGVHAPKYENFILGNINHVGLDQIIQLLPEIHYYKEYVEGIHQCEKKCEFFSFCGGGQASNKYFEHGLLNTMETAYCRNVKKRLIEGVLNSLEQ
ncbi:MAG: cyclophane-forming radical SAM peptide maturase AmcB [Bacteroidota bacterium]